MRFYLVIISLCLYVGGCSLPTTVRYEQLYSLTREEKKVKGAMLGKKKAILIKNFRQKQAYEEDIEILKQEVEAYIAGHPDLSEGRKADLRALKVTEGLAKEEVTLLLGEPDKVIKGSSKKAPYQAS